MLLSVLPPHRYIRVSCLFTSPWASPHICLLFVAERGPRVTWPLTTPKKLHKGGSVMETAPTTDRIHGLFPRMAVHAILRYRGFYPPDCASCNPMQFRPKSISWREEAGVSVTGIGPEYPQMFTRLSVLWLLLGLRHGDGIHNRSYVVCLFSHMPFCDIRNSSHSDCGPTPAEEKKPR